MDRLAQAAITAALRCRETVVNASGAPVCILVAHWRGRLFVSWLTSVRVHVSLGAVVVVKAVVRVRLVVPADVSAVSAGVPFDPMLPPTAGR